MPGIAKPAASKAAKAANRARYAPKAKALPTIAVGSREAIALHRLTGEVLESLKAPSAVPSRVVMQALLKARTL